jgi:tetratricopeptide (TPR) repeat protein
MLKQLLILLTLIMIIAGAASAEPKPEDKLKYQQYTTKGDTLKAQGKYKDAIKNYKKALKIENTSAQIYRDIALCFDKLNLPDSVITYYEGAIVYNPRDIDAYQQIAMINYYQQNPHEAMSWFERAMDLGTLSPQSYTALGNIYYHWKEYTRARGYYESSVTVDSNYSDGYYGIGLINMTIGDTNSAVDYFAKALQTGNSDKSAYMLGTIAFNRSQYDDAVKWFDQYLKAEPKGDFAAKADELKRIIALKKQPH